MSDDKVASVAQESIDYIIINQNKNVLKSEITCEQMTLVEKIVNWYNKNKR